MARRSTKSESPIEQIEDESAEPPSSVSGPDLSVDDPTGLGRVGAATPIIDDPTDLDDLNASTGSHGSHLLDVGDDSALGGLGHDAAVWDPFGGVDGAGDRGSTWDPLGGSDGGADGSTPPGLVDDSSWAMDGGADTAAALFGAAGDAVASGDTAGATELLLSGAVAMAKEVTTTNPIGDTDDGIPTDDSAVAQEFGHVSPHGDHESPEGRERQTSGSDQGGSQGGDEGEDEESPQRQQPPGRTQSDSTPIPEEADNGRGGEVGDTPPVMGGGEVDPAPETADAGDPGGVDFVRAGLGAVDGDPSLEHPDAGEVDPIAMGVGEIDPVESGSTLLAADGGDLSEMDADDGADDVGFELDDIPDGPGIGADL